MINLKQKASWLARREEVTLLVMAAVIPLCTLGGMV